MSSKSDNGFILISPSYLSVLTIIIVVDKTRPGIANRVLFTKTITAQHNSKSEVVAREAAFAINVDPSALSGSGPLHVDECTLQTW